MSTTPMFSPDGTLGDVPHERVSDAQKSGFKIGQELVSPKGEVGVVPMDRAIEAMRAGFMPRSMANMPGGPQSQPMSPVDISGNPQTPEAATAGLPGMTGNRPVTGRDLLPGSIVGGAAAAAAAPHAAILGGLASVGKAAIQTLPYVAAGEAINYARKNIPGGKYIPQGAEMIPLFMSGAKGAEGKTAAETIGTIKERAAAAAPMTAEEIAAQRFQHVPMETPLPNPMKPTAASTVDPYREQLLPKMQPGTSTTIEAHGYNPNTQEAVVHFKNGGVYKYKGVPQQVYNQFQNSESQGSFHANNLKGRYVTEKIGQMKPNRFSPGGKQ